MRWFHWLGCAALGAGAFVACGEDEDVVSPPPTGGAGGSAGAAGHGGAPVAPGADFDRYCEGAAWDDALEPVTAGELTGDYAGVLQDALPNGSLATMKII